MKSHDQDGSGEPELATPAPSNDALIEDGVKRLESKVDPSGSLEMKSDTTFRDYDSGHSSTLQHENGCDTEEFEPPRNIVEAKRSISMRHSRRALGELVDSGSSFESPVPTSTRPGAKAMQGKNDPVVDEVPSNTGNESYQDEETPAQVLVEAELVDQRNASPAPIVQATPMEMKRKWVFGVGVLLVAVTVGVVSAIVFGTRSSAQSPTPPLPANDQNTNRTFSSTPTFAPCSGGFQSDGFCSQANYSACDRFVGGYLPNWFGDGTTPPHRVDTRYNTLFIFHAQRAGGGTVQYWPPYPSFYGDCQLARDQGRRLVLTVGGSNHRFQLQTRNESTAFVNSIQTIVDEFGGLDGLDWNNFDADTVPNTTEMIYASQQLKSIYGESFLITAPATADGDADRNLARAMNEAGVLDFVTPLFYGAPGKTDAENLMRLLGIWTESVGQEKVVVGLGVRELDHFMSISQANSTMQQALIAYPNIRGATQWEVHYDALNGNGFAGSVAPLLCEPTT